MPTRNGHRYLEHNWASCGEVDANVTARATELDRRSAHRVALEASVSYVSDGDQSSQGEGRLVELSKEGCRIVGCRPVPVGSNLALSVGFSDGQPPICLSAAQVCWADTNTFGVRFAEMPANERQRLQQLVWRFASRRGESGEHTEFRFA